MTFDQAQSARIAQRIGVEFPGVRLVDYNELPEVSHKGQLIYERLDEEEDPPRGGDVLLVYDGDNWQTVGDFSASVVYVQSSEPSDPNVGDQWQNTLTGQLLTWDGSDWLDAIGPDQVTATEVAPDSITANEIAANTITANEIAADTITTNELAADSITTNELSANSITSKHTITGAVVQTAAPGSKRIVMRNDGSGGIIEGFTGNFNELSQSVVDPLWAGDGRPALVLRAGSAIGGSAGGGAAINLYGDGPGAIDPWIWLRNDTTVTGSLTADQLYASSAPTGTGTVCVLGASGQIKYQTSSARYKDDIEDLELDVHQALKLRPRQFKDKATGEKLAGFVAEEAADLGFERWVGRRSEDKKPESFRYQEWTAVLQKVCQSQQRQIDELKHRITTLESMVGRHP